MGNFCIDRSSVVSPVSPLFALLSTPHSLSHHCMQDNVHLRGPFCSTKVPCIHSSSLVFGHMHLATTFCNSLTRQMPSWCPSAGRSSHTKATREAGVSHWPPSSRLPHRGQGNHGLMIHACIVTPTMAVIKYLRAGDQ